MVSRGFEPYWALGLLLTGGIYLLVLSAVRRGLRRLGERARGVGKHSASSAPFPFVSIIIPCRDEAEHIGKALADLSCQNFPKNGFEVIVVDDRSDDGSGEIARSFASAFLNLKVLRVQSCPEGISPKKNALRRGFAAARGEIFVTTDADCRFGGNWLAALLSEFDPGVGLVTGLTVFDRARPEPFWQRLQQLDYLSHSFFAAGAISQGMAFNCNGSNLALRREVFEGLKGYDPIQQVITGDDTLLVQRLRSQGRWQIRYSSHPDCLVRSWPEETPAEVLHQRLRWGSGGLSYSPPALAFASATFVFYLLLLLSPILWAWGQISAIWILIFLLKIWQDGRVMKMGYRAFQLKSDWRAFAVLALAHVPAILFFSIGGHLLGFRWKGTRFRRTRAMNADSCEATPT